MALRIVPTTPRPNGQLGSRINRTPRRQPGDAMSSHMMRSLLQLNRSAGQGSEIPALTEDVIGEISNEANWSYEHANKQARQHEDEVHFTKIGGGACRGPRLLGVLQSIGTVNESTTNGDQHILSSRGH